MRYRALGRTGMRVSTIGFGASPIGNEFAVMSDTESQRAVDAAIDGGINFFDVSPYYGRTLAETRLGTALVGKRNGVYLATKCGRYDFDGFDFSAKRVRTSVDESLKRLRTDYLDLLQAHDIEFGNAEQIINETVPAMREIQRAGKVRFIGITSYRLDLLCRVLEQSEVDTVLSYCRYNLLIDDMDQVLTPVAKERNLGLMNASPLHMGVITAEGPPAWHPAPDNVKAAGAQIAQMCAEQGFSPAQVALRFCLDHPYVSTTLVGMGSAEQVQENLRALDLELDPGLLHQIQQAIGPAKNVTWRSGL